MGRKQGNRQYEAVFISGLENRTPHSAALFVNAGTSLQPP